MQHRKIQYLFLASCWANPISVNQIWLSGMTTTEALFTLPILKCVLSCAVFTQNKQP